MLLLYPNTKVAMETGAGRLLKLSTFINMSMQYGIQQMTKEMIIVTMILASFTSCFLFFSSVVCEIPAGATFAFDLLTSMKISVFDMIIILAGPQKHTSTMNTVYIVLLCHAAKQILCTG